MFNKVYLVGYDLKKSGQDYQSLYDAIKQLGSWWHCLDSTWLVSTNRSATQIRDSLNNHIDSNDKLLVIGLKSEAAWTGMSTTCSNWLKEQLEGTFSAS